MTRISIRAAACAFLSIAGVCAAFAEDATASDSAFGVVFTGGIGYTWLKSNEFVYDADNGNRVSQLIWETNAPVATLGANALVMDHWTIDANLALGFNGDSDMADYDWIEPNNPSYAFGDWTDRSLHPDTRLDRYVNFDIAAGRNFDLNDKVTINLHGGFKYTDYKASAYGGTFIYSNGGFRNDVGSFDNGSQGITYEQRMPTVFGGIQGTINCDQWTFTGLVRGGATVGATDTDYHWKTGTRFAGDYDTIPFLSAGGRADYHVTEQVSIFVAGNFDKYFHTKANVTLYDIATGAKKDGPINNGSGMDLRSFQLSGGLKVSF